MTNLVASPNSVAIVIGLPVGLPQVKVLEAETVGLPVRPPASGWAELVMTSWVCEVAVPESLAVLPVIP